MLANVLENASDLLRRDTPFPIRFGAFTTNPLIRSIEAQITFEGPADACTSAGKRPRRHRSRSRNPKPVMTLMHSRIAGLRRASPR